MNGGIDMEVINYSVEIARRIDEIFENTNTDFYNNNHKNIIGLFEEAWELLPDPKTVYDESYLIVENIVNEAIFIGDIDTANKWVEKIFVCSLERIDDGEREYLAGKVAFERGDFKKAKEYLTIADKKSGGRCFIQEELKYFSFLKGDKISEDIHEIYSENKEEIEEKTYNKIIEFCDNGDLLAEQNAFSRSIEEYKKALELIPYPKENWEASTWVYTALGDVYFLDGKFEEALENLYDAINCPDGFSNGFILMRIGQCLYELNNMEKAKEFLLRAYMLEGEDVFECDDSKYLEFVK